MSLEDSLEKLTEVNKLEKIHNVTPRLKDILMKRGSTPELSLKTLPSLNKKIWGVHKQKLLLVGARPSNGKSSFVINIANILAQQDKKILFLSLEMPREKITERMFCMNNRINNIDLLVGKFVETDIIQYEYKKFEDKVKYWSMLISDCIGKNWQWLENFIFKCLESQPDVVIIDHIQEIRGGQSQKAAIDEYISKMREFAIRYNFALIICTQINRDVANDGDHQPKIHQLKGSGYLEEAADQVLLLHWPFYYAQENNKVDKERFIINIAKNRDGMTGYVEINYKPEYYLFYDKENKNGS